MSSREHWPNVRSSVVPGDVISGGRDNDTHSYRLFVNKGWEDVPIGSTTGHHIQSCECCDLSVEDMRALASILEEAIAAHQPWPEEEQEQTNGD